MKARPVAGFHAVNARLKHAPESIVTLYVAAQRRDARMRELLARAEQAGVKVLAVDERRLEGLAGGAAHQGVVALCTEGGQAPKLEDVLASVTPDTLLLLLDGVTDPRNLGACLRTADAAGVNAVIVPRDRSAPLTAAADKAAAGAAATLPLVAVTNLARAMDEINSVMTTVLPTPAPPKIPVLPPLVKGAIRSMTLIPVSKICTLVDCWSKAGAGR